ncbi:MAG: hypothetical protein JXA25_17275 [Anaerolineales bacterium]|nr:hypothetical protein [Anaerolineales bacterium]
MAQSRMEVPFFNSAALKGNYLQDPVSRNLHIYLPEAYFQYKNKRFPVVYYLTGYASRGASMMNQIPWGETIQQQMDRLIASGACQPLILVLPDCFTRLGGSQYINSTCTGNYEDYILEIVRHIDTNYRTEADRVCRAVAGKSSGGFGALYLAMHYPDIFGIVLDHSGDKFFEAAYYPDLLRLPDLLSGHDLQTVIHDPYNYEPKNGDFFQLMNLSAMAACYSPNPSAPFGFDWPVDPYTAELREEVWLRWLAYDPVRLVDSFQENLKALKLLYFDCGNNDEYFLHLGSRLLHRRLESLGILHHYEEFVGGHRHTRFRLDTHLEILSKTFFG